MATGATRASRVVAAAFLALLTLVVQAGPDEDYQAAHSAFRGGDMSGAMKILRKTSADGHVPSMLLLGYIYEQGSFDGDAVQMYRKAAATGSADGEVALAAMLAAGKGVPSDPAQAVRLYESAARRGNAVAVNVLAQAYISGTLGLTRGKRDNAQALAALERAAQKGYAPAAAELGRAYRDGDYGLAPDPVAAARWQPQTAAPAKTGPVGGKK
jgi:TPR repeat protein